MYTLFGQLLTTKCLGLQEKGPLSSFMEKEHARGGRRPLREDVHGLRVSVPVFTVHQLLHGLCCAV